MDETQISDIVDYSFLDYLDPPSSYPINSINITIGFESIFEKQCQHFLSSQYKFYALNKKVQQRLQFSLSGTTQLHNKLAKSSRQLDKIARELEKLNLLQSQSQKKQKVLKKLCEIVQMDQKRKILLEPMISDEKIFLKAMLELDEIVTEIKSWDQTINIVQQLKQQLIGLFQESIQKLIKEKLSPTLTQAIVGKYSGPILRDVKVASVFKQKLMSNRVNHFRLGLNPLINNINYVQNISQLYEKIIQKWSKMIDQEISLFHKQEVPQQLSELFTKVIEFLVIEIIPKLQRSIYKVKDIGETAKIRLYLSQLRKKLRQVNKLNNWDPLPKVLVKLQILLQEKLAEEKEALEIAKYNVYSLVSYIPIREHLENIRQCKKNDISEEMSQYKIQWQKPFENLAQSRDPSKQPKNKSLLIFNLNIWYLYKKIMKDGLLSERAQNALKSCCQKFVKINMQVVKKQYQSKEFIVLINLCADVSVMKKTLYSQTALLGHQNLRVLVQRELAKEFIKDIYQPLVQNNQIGTQGLSREQTLKLVQEKDINLNKFGKLSQNLKVYSAQQISVYLT